MLIGVNELGTQSRVSVYIIYGLIYETVVLMKIHPLRHGVSYHPPVFSFFFLCSFKKARKSRKKVLINLRLLFILSHKTVTCTRDTIIYAPAINIINRRNVYHIAQKFDGGNF